MSLKSDLDFWPLFWAHMNHRETRWSNCSIMLAYVGIVALTIGFYPAERQLLVICGTTLFFGYFLFSNPLNFTFAKINPEANRRHVLFLKEGLWFQHIVDLIIYVPICFLWGFAMTQSWKFGLILMFFGPMIALVTIFFCKRPA